jgi:hypothetical protein
MMDEVFAWNLIILCIFGIVYWRALTRWRRGELSRKLGLFCYHIKQGWRYGNRFSKRGSK